MAHASWPRDGLGPGPRATSSQRPPTTHSPPRGGSGPRAGTLPLSHELLESINYLLMHLLTRSLFYKLSMCLRSCLQRFLPEKGYCFRDRKGSTIGEHESDKDARQNKITNHVRFHECFLIFWHDPRNLRKKGSKQLELNFGSYAIQLGPLAAMFVLKVF